MNGHRNSSRSRCGLALCLLLFALMKIGWAVPAQGEAAAQGINASGNRNIPVAVDPIEDAEGYFAILYDNRNGLPTSEANAIAQTSEGFIWIGTYAGLIRYDGNTFERIESEEGILNTRCLYVDSQDRLWIGTNDFGLFLMTKDSLFRVDQPDQLASVSIRSIAEDSGGLIYVGTAMGVFTVDAQKAITAIDDARIAAKTVVDIRPGNDGLVYGSNQDGDLFILKDGAMLTYMSHEACGIESINAILPDAEQPGAVYLAAEDSERKHARIYHGAPEDGFATARTIDICPLSYVERMEAVDGEIWICAGNGIGKLTDDGVRLLKNVPMDKSVGHVMTDYEGNLWFTSSRQCVMKIVPNGFLDLFAQYDIPADVVNTTCMLGGDLFIGTDNMGLMIIRDGKRLDRLPLTEAATASGEALDIPDLLDYLKNERIRAIIPDSRGRLWICTWRHQQGLLRYDRGALMTFTTADGLLSNQVRTVSECADGSILVAQPDGMSVIRGDRVTAGYGARDGITVTSILTLTEGFNHELILGSDGGGLYVIGPDGTRHIGTDDGLKSEIILRVKRSLYQDIYWIATGNSIAYMTPDYEVTTIDQFPYSNNYDFFESAQRDLWVLSSNGIYVVSAEELQKNDHIDAVFYGVSNGLPYIATSNSFSALTEEGDLYMAGVEGTVRVNIDRSCENIGALKIALPYIDIDGKRSFPDASGSFYVPRGTKKVTVYPYVFSYTLIDPKVSYRLEGFDSADITVNRSKLEPVTYTNLRAGAYRFVIRVDDPIGEASISASCQIVRENVLSEGSYGTIILSAASLFLMAGILAYTSLFRKRGQVNDRLLFAMIVVNIVMVVMELGSYLLEGISISFLRELMYAENTAYYAALVLFPYLLLLYVEFIIRRDEAWFRKMRLVYTIPLLLYFILLGINLKTGWIFSITQKNTFHSGPFDETLMIPLLLYFLLMLVRVSRIDWLLSLIGALLIAIRFVWDRWYIGISSTSFVYTLFLTCVNIYILNRSMIGQRR